MSIHFHYVSVIPLDKGVVLLLNKLESSSRKDALSKVWLKLAHWISLFWKDVALHLDKLEFPLSNKYFFSASWNFLDEKGQQTNVHQKTSLESSVKETVIFHFQLSPPELKAQMSFSNRQLSVVFFVINVNMCNLTCCLYWNLCIKLTFCNF